MRVCLPWQVRFQEAGSQSPVRFGIEGVDRQTSHGTATLGGCQSQFVRGRIGPEDFDLQRRSFGLER